MGKSIEQLRDEYVAKKLEGNTLPYGMEYLNLLSKFIEEADALYPMPTEKICTGCGRSNLDTLGTNQKGEPFLACCPDSNYKEVKKQSSVEWLFQRLQSEPFLTVEDFKQAKAMHRKEIEQSYIAGAVNEFDCIHHGGLNISGKQYYNETFGE